MLLEKLLIMITNDKANMIIDVIKTLIELKECGKLFQLDFNWDEENNTFNITTVPKQAIQHIECNFTLTSEGAVFEK